MTKNGLCLPSPMLNCRFLEGRSEADSSVSLPHPADYFAESWHSVKCGLLEMSLKPVHRMTDDLCFLCLLHAGKGQSYWSSAPTGMAPGRGGDFHLQHSQCASLPKPTQATNSPFLSQTETIWGNLLDLGVALTIELHWACGVTTLSIGIWESCGHAKEECRGIISLLRVKLLLSPNGRPAESSPLAILTARTYPEATVS